MAIESDSRPGILQKIWNGFLKVSRLIALFIKSILKSIFGGSDDKVQRLPVHHKYKYIPALPYQIKMMLKTAAGLATRSEQTEQSQQGLTNVYTLGGMTTTGYELLYGKVPSTARDDDRESLGEELELELESVFSKIEAGIEEKLSSSSSSYRRIIKRISSRR